MANNMRLKNAKELARKNDADIHEMVDQFKSLEGRLTMQMAAHSSFKQIVESRFTELLKIINDNFGGRVERNRRETIYIRFQIFIRSPNT